MSEWTAMGNLPNFVRAWLGARNDILANPRFQRWAMTIPLVRTVARRRADAAFDIVAGFVYAQVLQACFALGLLTRLRRGGASLAELASETGVPEPSIRRLVEAATAIGVLEMADGRCWLGRHGATLADNAGVAAMVAHHRMFYADLADPVALLKRGGGGGQLADFWRYGASGSVGGDAVAERYSALMSASQPIVSETILDAYPLKEHRHLLDIGGGAGAFLIAAAARAPQLALSLFDLPAVAPIASTALHAAGLSQATVHAGDFQTDPIPGGADLVTLIRVLHDHDDDVAAALLAKIRGAMTSGARLLIAEPMAGAGGAGRMGDAYFSMYLLAMGSGRPRTAAEIRSMVRLAGFRRSWRLVTRNPLAAQVIVASA
jgi:demethylspheroidene O-methyltransferase